MRGIFNAVVAIFIGLWAAPFWAANAVQTLTTPSGINAWLVEDHNIPFVALELHFRGGSALEPMAKRGVTQLMTGLLEEGSGEMDAQAFAAAKEGLAASFGYRAYQDVLGISARFLTANRAQSVALLRQSLIAPRFDEDAIERVRAQILTGIRAQTKDPNDLVGKAFDAEAYGDHPYGSDDLGTIETVSALSRDDIISSHRNTLVRGRVVVSAVGDITAEELSALIEDLLGDLPPSSELPLLEPASIGLQTGVKVIDFPTPQSVALFGHAGIDRDDPDFFAAYILNYIFGGSGFESRLMRELRETRGLTYGVNTYLVTADYADLYLGQFASANERVAEAIDVLKAEWEKIAREGITEEELVRAKTYLTGAYPLRFDGNAKIARILAGMQLQGLDPSYIDTRNARIEAVSLAEANRVAARLFQPESLRIMVIGTPLGL